MRENNFYTCPVCHEHMLSEEHMDKGNCDYPEGEES